jgi:hypothetical protein
MIELGFLLTLFLNSDAVQYCNSTCGSGRMLVVGGEEKFPCGSEEAPHRDAVADSDFQGA